MTLRAGDGFRFPNQKYDDSKALYTNFRYMQEYLNRIFASDRSGPDYVIASSTTVNPARADFQADGENDEQTILQAILALGSQGGWIHCMPGTFNFGSSLEILSSYGPLKITGSGWSTIFKLSASVNADVITIRKGPLMLADFKVDGNRANNTAGHGINQPSEFQTVFLKNLWVTECDQYGISMNRTGGDSYIESCLANNNDEYGILLYGEGSGYISNSTTHNNGDSGIRAGAGDCRIIGCRTYSNTGAGIEISGSVAREDNIITNNVIESNSSHGISATNVDNTVIVGNRISSNTGTSVIIGPASIVIGNILNSNGTDTPSAGANSVVGYNVVGGAAVTADHGSLSGLADDDHTQYHNDARAVVWHDADDHSALTITESQITDLDHTDVAAIHDNVAGEISAITTKATPTTSDYILIEDAADSNNKKKITIGTLPGSASDHGVLTGLADDDHTQYLTETRHGGVHAVLKAYRSTNQSINAATDTTVAFDTIEIEDDPDDDVDINTGTGIITINTTGIYVVTFNARWAAGATQHHAFILHGSTEVARSTNVMDTTGIRINHSVSAVISATATNTVTCRVWQNSGAAKNLIGAVETHVSIYRIK